MSAHPVDMSEFGVAAAVNQEAAERAGCIELIAAAMPAHIDNVHLVALIIDFMRCICWSTGSVNQYTSDATCLRRFGSNDLPACRLHRADCVGHAEAR